MRVLILNQPFHPDVVATAQIAKDLADDLVARGHSVTAIASRSMYGRRGAVLPRRERAGEIEIIRVGSNLFGKGTVVGRLADFAGYYAMAALHGLFRRRFDVAVCLTTPPFIATVGLLLKRLRGTRVLLWTMDVYPDVMVAHGMIREGRFVHRVLRRLHARVLRRVDATIALGRCMKERLVAQGVPEGSIAVVPPWPVSPESVSGTPDADPAATPGGMNTYRREWSVGERLLVMYSGNFGLGHEVRTFLEAAERLKNDDRVRFAFLGGGKRWAEVESFVRGRGLTNCVLADYQPRERLADLLSAADVHLVTMLDDWWGLIVPSKFYGIAGAGRPALFIGPARSEIARTIDERSCGVRIAPGAVDELVARLGHLTGDMESRRTMGEHARAYAAAAASRAVCSGRIIDLIERLAGGAASSRAGAGHATMGGR